MNKINKEQIKAQIQNNISRFFGTAAEYASKEQIYKATIVTVRDLLSVKRKEFNHKVKDASAKRVYYLSIEFLLGRSLKNGLQNLALEDSFKDALFDIGAELEEIYDMEEDAGLGNGGLGRLAACFLDSLSSLDYPAMGFSLFYEYGLFKQKIVDSSQVEMPDMWLPSGEGWLVPRTDKAFTVRFGGRVEENWDSGKLQINYIDADEVDAIPYDMMISGASEAVSVLRLWKAQDNKNFNMHAFSQGEYFKAVEESTNAQLLSKVLYPEDNHIGGKQLRLMQQYMLVSASVQCIIHDHMRYYGTLENLADKVAIHINDTHPSLSIPELMRILVDEHSFSWEDAWKTTVNCISYTNHTVLPEALECWDTEMLSSKLPRIYAIIVEINRRFCDTTDFCDFDSMAIIHGRNIRMANLSVVGSHAVNGVSKLHSEILKTTVFPAFSSTCPERFTNVTNGIAHRRWLCGANEPLAAFVRSKIGDGYRKNPSELEGLLKYKDEKATLKKLKEIKYQNKVEFAAYAKQHYGVDLNPDTIFDVQIKRMHEYKRQLLNVLNIIGLYARLKENPNSPDIPAQTFIFGAKAAPGYYIAKELINLICKLSKHIDADVDVRDKLKVVFFENYNVTLAEHLIPASDISEQISLAGKEASGTGNMKFMLNGALTIGTFDGANVEISEAVGDENIFIFGMRAHEVDELWARGYQSFNYYNNNPLLRTIIELLNKGFDGKSFSGISNYLLFANNVSDPYMCLADFDSYIAAREYMLSIYANEHEWYKRSLVNIAKAGFFAADRSITEYAQRIWKLERMS